MIPLLQHYFPQSLIKKGSARPQNPSTCAYARALFNMQYPLRPCLYQKKSRFFPFGSRRFTTTKYKVGGVKGGFACVRTRYRGES